MGADKKRVVIVETLPARAGRSTVEMPVREGMTLNELLDALDIPGDTEAIIVNGVHVRPDRVLQDGDHVLIIPFMSGG